MADRGKLKLINSVSTGASLSTQNLDNFEPGGFIPTDRGNFAYAIMLFQGLANLFPWNAFITASSYFSSRFCGTPFASSFEAYFSFGATAFQTVGLALSVVYQERFTLHSRIIYPLLAYGAIFTLTTLLVLSQNFNGNPFFFVTILAVTLSGVCGAILSGGLFSMSAVFPPAYTAALMTGQAVAGVVVSSSDMITSLLGKQPENFCGESDPSGNSAINSTIPATTGDEICSYTVNYSAFAYFLIATVVLFASAALQYLLMKLPFTEFHMRRQGWNWMSSELSERISVAYQTIATGETQKERLLDPLLRYFSAGSSPASSSASVHGLETGANPTVDKPAAGSAVGGGSRAPSSPGRRAGEPAFNPMTLNDEASVAVSFHDSRLRRNPSLERQGEEMQASVEMGGISIQTIMRVGRSVNRPAFAAMFCFVVTLAVFPALTVFLRSEHKCEGNSTSRIFNDLYVPLFFLLYNAGDFSGRLVAGWYQMFNESNIIYPALLRIVFIPLFLLCNNEGTQVPVVFESDGWPITFMVLMAFSNGYVASSAMMIGPSIVDSRDKNLAGTIMIFCLTLGLMLGSIFSFSVVDISQGRV